jgi:SHS2 domain-containing protein
VQGEIFVPTRHVSGVEVKGITYHQFRVQPTETGWEAKVIVDV